MMILLAEDNLKVARVDIDPMIQWEIWLTMMLVLMWNQVIIGLMGSLTFAITDPDEYLYSWYFYGLGLDHLLAGCFIT